MCFGKMGTILRKWADFSLSNLTLINHWMWKLWPRQKGPSPWTWYEMPLLQSATGCMHNNAVLY